MHRKLLFFLGFAALVGATYYLFRGDFDRDLFFASFSNVRPAWILASIAITFFCYLIRSFRWQTLLISLKSISLGSLMSTTVLGFSAIFTFGRAGELVRPVWIARREGIPAMGSLAAIAVERVFDTLMLLLLFAAGFALVEPSESARISISGVGDALWVALAVVAGALFAFILLHTHIGSIAKRIPFQRLRHLLETFAGGLAATSTGKHFVSVTLSSLMLWLGIALQFWLMLTGLNLNLAFAAAMLTMVMAALGSIAQLPAIGGGFQAAFVFCLTSFFGVPPETAVAASLLAWVITVGPTMLVGTLYMLWKGISTKDLALDGTSSVTSEL